MAMLLGLTEVLLDKIKEGLDAAGLVKLASTSHACRENAWIQATLEEFVWEKVAALSVSGNTELEEWDRYENSAALSAAKEARAEGAKELAALLMKTTTPASSITLCGVALPIRSLKGTAHDPVEKLGMSGRELCVSPGIVVAKLVEFNTRLTDLDVHASHIDVISVRAFAAALRTNTTLQTLDISENYTTMNAIARVLEVNKTLQTLNISKTGITFDGWKAIAKALKTNKTLRTLSASFIGTEGCSVVAGALKANKTLHMLNVSSNSVGPAGGSVFASALWTNVALQTLDISSNSIGPTGGSAFAGVLGTNTTLRELYILNNCIGSTGGSAIAKALGTNKTLQMLDISSNSIGSAGWYALAEALGTNTTLQTMYISANPIGTEECIAFAEALKANATLQTLDISANCINPAGCYAFAKVLECNQSLTSLDLSCNRDLQGNVYMTGGGPQLGDSIDRLARGLRVNSALTALDISLCGIDEHSVNVIQNHVPRGFEILFE